MELTRHRRGSLRELLHIAFPLMLSVLSGNLMQFADRLVLARYATESMNAAVVAGMFSSIFIFGVVGIVAITEVFVGRFNGAGEMDRIGRPVWQMVWFSLFTLLIFIPVALFFGRTLVGPQYAQQGVPYFQIMLFFGPAFSLVTAFSAFFIGMGKVRLVMVATAIANLINIALNIPFVFTLNLGTSGAALATGISQIIQVVILVIFFFNRNHLKYGTRDMRLRPGLLWDCLRIGVPSALGHMIEIGAWAAIMRMVGAVSAEHMTIAAIGASFFTLFAFMTEGVQKAVSTIAANFIGAKDYFLVAKLLRSSTLLILILAAGLAIPLLAIPEPIIDLFIIDGNHAMIAFARITCFWVWIYFIVDGMTWLFAGVITAGGDTKFVMLMNGISAWFFAFIPSYFVIYRGHASPAYIWAMVAAYGMANATCFYLRYRTKQWQSINMLS